MGLILQDENIENFHPGKASANILAVVVIMVGPLSIMSHQWQLDQTPNHATV